MAMDDTLVNLFKLHDFLINWSNYLKIENLSVKKNCFDNLWGGGGEGGRGGNCHPAPTAYGLAYTNLYSRFEM